MQVWAGRLSAPRLHGPAMVASSWVRTRASASIRRRSPPADRRPGAPRRLAMRSGYRQSRPLTLHAPSMSFDRFHVGEHRRRADYLAGLILVGARPAARWSRMI
jgi:hypothetical protein